MAHISATGYVHRMLDERQAFRDYALSCARAFGALVMMRDDPMGAEIPTEFQPSDFYQARLAEARAELARLQAMTSEQRIAHGHTLRTKAIEMYRGILDEQGEEVQRCRYMLKEVEAWQPPSDEHKELKKFMREQLTQSIGDGDAYWHEAIARAEAKEPGIYFADAVATAQQSIDSCVERHNAELERTRSRNEWVTALRASLPTEG